MTVHPHANAFDAAAEEYERGRPGYPQALLDWLESLRPLDSSSVVLDLGAGTGKLTRLLAQSAAHVIAVEPLAAMREICAALVPSAEVLDGTAETIPLGDETVDIVTCGQSFRWFASDAALTEIARVLRPGGELIIVFNSDATSTASQRAIIDLLRSARAEAEAGKPGLNWREVIDATTKFALLTEVSFDNPHFVDREGLFGRAWSSSQFARLSPARQQEFLAGLDALIEGDTVDLSQVTEVTALKKLAS